MPTRRVIDRDQIWSEPNGAYQAAGVGAITAIIFLLIASFVEMTGRVAAGREWMLIAYAVTSALLFLVWPLTVMCVYRHQIRSNRRAMLFGAGFGFGVYCIPLLSSAILAAISKISLGQFLTAVVISLPVIAAGTLISLAGWRILIRRLPERVILQDGALCPNCAYSLIGNTSGVCPECGHVLDGLADQGEPLDSAVND